MMFIARYWRALAIAAAVGLVLVALQRCTERAEQRGYERATAEMAERVRLANEHAAAIEEASRQRIQEVDHAHQKALADLNARYAARPVPAVRVCRAAAGGGQVPAVASTTSSDPGTAAADGLPGGVSADIGPAVERRILRPADVQTQQLIACQSYVREIQEAARAGR